MKSILNNLFKDFSLWLGLLLYIISTFLYLITDHMPVKRDLFSQTFFVHYVIAVTYFIIMIIRLKWRAFWVFSSKYRSQYILLLLLLNISAYSLNKTLNVFNESTTWVVIFLIIENITLLIYALVSIEKPVRSPLLLFVCSILLVFNIYQAIMVMPIYPIGIVGLFFFGISGHAFVPLIFVFFILKIIIEQIRIQTHWMWFVSGLIVVISIISFYAYKWDRVDQIISERRHDHLKPNYQKSSRMPEWIDLAQRLDFNPVTKKYLKSGILYQEFIDFSDLDWMNPPLNFDGKKRHDPLVAMSTLIVGRPELFDDTRIKILNYSDDLRHESTDRFWSGLNLSISDVVTNVKLFPSCRMAYTEQIMFIRNNDNHRRWFNSEEAIFTFQLTEGSVVTSLSLWIEGKEEKARLTTKSKAEEAYNTIVGREARDPSVVYWMEGNKIRVRVFPCIPEEDRQFKIGITSPLLFKNNQLVYQSIRFKGPDYNKSRHSVNVLFNKSGSIQHATINLEANAGQYEWQGKYQSDWQIIVKPEKLTRDWFTFDGNSYSITEYNPVETDFAPEVIYLDINNTWTRDEISSILNIIKGKNVYVNTFDLYPYDPEFDPLMGKSPNFTLFPFEKVKSPSEALIITKGTPSPNLSDLDSTFKEPLFNAIKQQNSKYYVFDLGNTPSDYIRSLKEFQVLNYQSGSVDDIQKIIRDKKYLTEPEDPDKVFLSTSRTSIQKTAQKGSGKAPDHLARLYIYNKLMKSIGRAYFNDDYINNELISYAQKAYVVSPVSSLIVLETVQDYERFEIDKTENSLGNAQMNSSGAVPEPHEWAIIILLAAFILYIWKRKRTTSLS